MDRPPDSRGNVAAANLTSSSKEPSDEAPLSIVELATRLPSVTEWLIGSSRSRESLELLLEGLCLRLIEAGLPVAYMRLGTRTLHPLLAAWGAIWTRDGGAGAWQGGFDILDPGNFAGSPAEQLLARGQPLRRRMADVVAEDHVTLRDFQRAGYTDYLAVQIPSADSTLAFFSILTRHAEGWTEEQIRLLQSLAAFVAQSLEIFNLRRISQVLLETYIGDRSAVRVLAGHIRRGDVEKIRAAVLYTDLRDFTGISSALSLEGVVDLLNAYFDLIGSAVIAARGEILVLVGDAVVAVFPGIDGSTSEPADRALKAARDAHVLAGAANQLRREEGRCEIAFGIGLGIGEIALGNVGTQGRLGFNVIGPTVNLSARIESLTKLVGIPLLASADFAAACSEPFRHVGCFALKGLALNQDVFTTVEFSQDIGRSVGA
jgi:adenylate cyclase